MSGKSPDGTVAHLPLSGAAPLEARPAELPAGKLEVVVTYLEMHQRPVPRPRPHRGERLALMRASRPTASYYRYLYETVGAPWLWYERRLLDDRALLRIVHDPGVDVEVLYVDGVPAGYFELDRRRLPEVELAYFGLAPEFIGRGLGGWLLDRAVEHAWVGEPSRVWVHTCTLDHPSALGVYQRAGFVPYRRASEIIDDPRQAGHLPGA
jgi:GNAT superfamily N-acetyltransferase